MFQSYHGEFFAVSFPEGLGPANLARISLSFESLVAFRSAETKLLLKRTPNYYKYFREMVHLLAHLTVIPHKHYPMTRIDGRGAEIAFLHSHLEPFSTTWSNNPGLTFEATFNVECE